MCTTSTSDAHGGLKRASHSLELEGLMTVSHYVVLGTEPRSSGRDLLTTECLSSTARILCACVFPKGFYLVEEKSPSLT